MQASSLCVKTILRKKNDVLVKKYFRIRLNLKRVLSEWGENIDRKIEIN